MGSHVTFPKVKKAVHKVMIKYGKKKFYRKIDWIHKVLKKLKLRPSMSRKARIRNHINSWIRENSETSENKADSKKGILDRKPNKNIIDNKSDSKGKKNDNNNSSQENQAQVDSSKPDSSNINIPPMPEGILIKDLKKNIPLIDLILEDEIVNNEVEIITIEDNDEIFPDNVQMNVNIEEEVLSRQPPTIPEEHYPIPDYSLYNIYHENNDFFCPFIGHPHLCNF